MRAEARSNIWCIAHLSPCAQVAFRSVLACAGCNFPASATEITLEGPQTLTTRTGRQLYGVAVHYRYHLRGATAHRDKTTYALPPRWTERTKVVELPQGVKALSLTDQAIVNILKEGGVQIARRTVAKYRDQLGVLSARMRKRVGGTKAAGSQDAARAIPVTHRSEVSRVGSGSPPRAKRERRWLPRTPPRHSPPPGA